VQIDGQPYRLAVDTGAPGSILLFPRAAARSGLFDGRPYAPQIVGGFGGYSRKLGRRVRATKLEFGPLALKRPFVTVMDPKETMSFGLDGLIGLPIISLFDVATEADAGKIWLARNSIKPTAEPYGRSGIWLAPKGTDTVVTEVGTGSPAAAAGVRVGDVLVGPKELGEAIKLLSGNAGQEITLSFRRDGAVAERSMTLADYL
jgi:serine protease Do